MMRSNSQAQPGRHVLRLTRRELLGSGLLAVLGTGWIDAVLREGSAAVLASEPSALRPLQRFPRMVHEYFTTLVAQIDESARRARAALKTHDDAQAYIASVRERIAECFGPWPEKTPLNPRVTGVLERDGYRVEKVVFESRPEFYVTANLYVPKDFETPRPGVVGTCGHSTNGKAAAAYQSFAQGLARLGYVVLLYDPIGQGERLQYVDPQGRSRVGPGVREHLYAGNQQVLVGEFFGSWRAWDGIRALDYLLTRSEVDPKQVGVTGNSGGGTMTTWLCGVENRWSMAAPSCFVTTFRRNLENELPADIEQCPPRALKLGLDHADFLAVMAPKPLIILAQEKDYFDIRGTLEAYTRLKRLYELLEAPDQIALHVGSGYHGYSQENREAMYRWFNRATGISEAQSEPALVLEKDEDLWCTRSGQIAEFQGRTVFSFTQSKAKQLEASRQPLEREALIPALKRWLKLPVLPTVTVDAQGVISIGGQVAPTDPKKLVEALRRQVAVYGSDLTVHAESKTMHSTVLAVLDAAREAGFRNVKLTTGPTPTETAKVPEFRILRAHQSRRFPRPHWITYAVQTEPGIHATVYFLSDERWYSRPPSGERRAILYVSHHSADEELRQEPLVRDLIEEHSQLPFFACDLRGIGESRPGTCGPDSFLKPYGSDYFYAVHSLMLDRPYLGQRTFDLLRVLDWLASFGYTQIRLAALGWGTLPATFAALLSPHVAQVTLKHALRSYAEVATSEFYDWPLSTFLPDVLSEFDLPDCYRALAAKGLRQIEPVGARYDQSSASSAG